MHRILLAALLIAFLTSPIAHAQLGTICIYTDATASQCNIAGTDIVQVLYVVHVQTAGATGIRYSAPVPGCWTGAVFVTDVFQHPMVIGGSQTGVSVSYGACMSGAVYVQTIVLVTEQPSQPDCAYPVLPDPLATQIEVVDCSSNVVPGIGGTSYINSTIPCSCDGGATQPVLSVSPGHIDFGKYLTEKSFHVANAGTGTLTWSVSESIPWLDASPTSGTDAGTVALTVDRTGLAFGTYTGTIDVTSNGGSQGVSVSMEVAPLVPVLRILTESIHLDYDVDASPVVFGNWGNADLAWSIVIDEPWLSASPASGTIAPGVFIVESNITVDRSGLADGTHAQTLHVTSNGGDGDIAVTVDVATGPRIEVFPSLLEYSPSTTSHTFDIRDTGPVPLSWTLSASAPWITIVPPLSGTGDATVTVNVDPTLVPPGDLVTGEVTISSNAGNAGVEIVQIAFFRTGAPGGVIGLFTDAAATNCAIYDVEGVVSVYAVLTATPGAAAIQFAAPKPDCMNATWLADESQFPLVIGDSQTGAAIAFGGCAPAPIHVMTIHYAGTGTTPACCEYPVIPDPRDNTGIIEVVDCSNTSTFAMSRSGFVNPDGECNCGVPVTVETKTWGAVKALYLPPSEEE